jgi:hypothetical protein
MALIKCPICGKLLPDHSDTCIHCGYVFPTTPVSTVEVSPPHSDDAERMRSSTFGYDFAERKIRHKWDKLCFFVPPFGMYLTITYAFDRDRRWRNSLWSTFLGAVFYFCVIELIIGFIIS